MCVLLANVKANVTKNLYYNEKSYIKIIFRILYVVKNKLDGIKDSKFYDTVINKSTNISVISHFVVFVTLIKEGMSECVFLGLLYTND